MNRLLLIAVILSSLAFGCGYLSKFTQQGTETPSNTSGASNASGDTDTGSVTAGNDPRAELIRAANRFIELPSYSATVDSTGDNPMKMTLEYVKPDRYHLTTEVGPTQFESIMIGKDSYMKIGGRWLKSPVKMPVSIPSLRDEFTQEGIKTLTDVKYEGESSVDGKPALLYSYHNTTLGSNRVPYTSRIWVSKSNGAPMKVEVRYEKGELKDLTILYDTETPVTIEAPAAK